MKKIEYLKNYNLKFTYVTYFPNLSPRPVLIRIKPMDFSPNQG
jgi:hypothetical protein